MEALAIHFPRALLPRSSMTQTYPHSLSKHHTMFLRLSVGSGIESGTGSFEYDDNCTLTAQPSEGYYFEKWTGNGISESNNSSINLAITAGSQHYGKFPTIHSNSPCDCRHRRSYKRTEFITNTRINRFPYRYPIQRIFLCRLGW